MALLTGPVRKATGSEEETAAFARSLSAELREGDVVCLQGELGAGKTAFTRGLMQGIRGTAAPEVKSPTYTILNVYEGSPPVHHFDLYRVDNPLDISALGLDEFWGRGISIVEWPKSFCYSLPGRKIDVSIMITGENDRMIEVSALHVG